MAVRGVKPQENPLHAGRGRVHEWSEVVNAPYAGTVPVRLPTKTVRLLPFGGTEDLPVHPMTKAWWKAISRMPHCVLWTESDWHFALATALVADRFHYGHNSSATELGRREKVLGTTVDARRDLRIRYVDPPAAPSDGATVTRLDDYRDL